MILFDDFLNLAYRLIVLFSEYLIYIYYILNLNNLNLYYICFKLIVFSFHTRRMKANYNFDRTKNIYILIFYFDRFQTICRWFYRFFIILNFD